MSDGYWHRFSQGPTPEAILAKQKVRMNALKIEAGVLIENSPGKSLSQIAEILMSRGATDAEVIEILEEYCK